MRCAAMWLLDCPADCRPLARAFDFRPGDVSDELLLCVFEVLIDLALGQSPISPTDRFDDRPVLLGCLSQAVE